LKNVSEGEDRIPSGGCANRGGGLHGKWSIKRSEKQVPRKSLGAVSKKNGPRKGKRGKKNKLARKIRAR